MVICICQGALPNAPCSKVVQDRATSLVECHVKVFLPVLLREGTIKSVAAVHVRGHCLLAACFVTSRFSCLHLIMLAKKGFEAGISRPFAGFLSLLHRSHRILCPRCCQTRNRWTHGSAWNALYGVGLVNLRRRGHCLCHACLYPSHRESCLHRRWQARKQESQSRPLLRRIVVCWWTV